MALPGRLKPSRHIPHFAWSASTRWELRPATIAVLLFGLWAFGTGDALLLRAGIGNTPWTVLAEGLGERTGLSVGVLTILIGATVLLLWIPLGERPGLGTIANIVVIGVAIDVMAAVLPAPQRFGAQLAQAVLGILLVGVGGALYLSSQLGPGPRDGWMTGVGRRFDWPISWVRLGIEVTVLAMGVALGGTFGLGTVLFALFIGHSLGWSLVALGRVRATDREGTLGAGKKQPE